MKVTLCSGHRNIENCIYPNLRGGTGTSFNNGESERDYVDDLIRRITPILQGKGIEVEYCDAVGITQNGTAEGDLCLFLHVDGALNSNYRGGLVDWYRETTTPDKDEKLANCIINQYFAKCPIPLEQGHRNDNTGYYWAYRHVGVNTAGVLVELGTARITDADAPYLQGQRNDVAKKIANAIFCYFGLPIIEPQPSPQPKPEPKPEPLPKPLPEPTPIPSPTPEVETNKLLLAIKNILEKILNIFKNFFKK